MFHPLCPGFRSASLPTDNALPPERLSGQAEFRDACQNFFGRSNPSQHLTTHKTCNVALHSQSYQTVLGKLLGVSPRRTSSFRLQDHKSIFQARSSSLALQSVSSSAKTCQILTSSLRATPHLRWVQVWSQLLCRLPGAA